ncbi:inositol monophosphatase family protein [Sphingosinicella terrae]|uniref:inositol monophosphatase family protein n=1 Tax=Sphingosinicella terrae TaxID=2172047 RepID=UPI000E0DD99A|nr:inositol monophosphatase family protein [Sphingosinicella terrae]
MQAFIDLAADMADAARRVTLPVAETILACDNKAEGAAFDPVTEADREAERAMRALVEARFPDHGIAGEEMDLRPPRGPYGWSLDPIDGTRAFICGLPGWTTLIALLEQDEPVLGIIDAPRLDERYFGAGGRAWLVAGGIERVLATSGCNVLAEAKLATTDPFLFGGGEAEAFDRLRRAARLTRYGFDAYAYARLAAGRIDLVAESGLKPHDLNALVPVVLGAGGVVGNWRGGADLGQGQLLAAASQDLFDAAVETLGL